jgi:hypothetical protein
MIKAYIISGICFLISFFWITRYSSGMGAPLGSYKKKLLFILSLMFFIGFIIFLIRGFYFGENQKQKENIIGLKREISAFHEIVYSQSVQKGLLDQKDLYNRRKVLIQAVAGNPETILSSNLINQYFESEDRTMNENDLFHLAISRKISIIEEYSQQIDSKSFKERDTYFIILINILSTFLGFVIAFTYKNKILA